MTIKRIKNKKINKIVIYAIFIFFCLFILYPIWCIVSVSLTGKEEITTLGFSLFPHHIDISAYKFLYQDAGTILRSYWITIAVSFVGTIIGAVTTAMYAYVLSKRDYPIKKILSFLLLFTMFFGGGMAAKYIVNVSFLGLKNTFWVLVLPQAFSAINVIILRAYYLQLPYSMVESAKIDGSGEYGILLKIMIPLSKPALATVCLTLFITYWNAYYEAMMYMDTGRYVTIQLLLHRLMSNVDFLKSNSSSILSQQEIKKLPGDSLRMAVCTVTIVPVLIVFPRFQKYFVKGMALGAVKE